MHAEDAGEEIKRLRRCINDLVSLLALPASWSGGEPSHIVQSLLDVLMRLLSLDLSYLRLNGPIEGSCIEAVRVVQGQSWISDAEICNSVRHCFDGNSHALPLVTRKSISSKDIFLVPLQLGLHGEIGLLVAGSQRANFPNQPEKLVLNVAANQAAIGLQEARMLDEQRRVASELDERVAQRTREIDLANNELKKEIADRKLKEEKLRLHEEALHKAHTQIARSEERWRSVFENSAIGVALTDLNGRFIATNPVYQNMLGYTDEELQGRSFLDITYTEQLEKSLSVIGELLSGECKQFQIENQYRRKDGTLVWVRNHVSLVPGSERVPRFLMALSEDITERKQAEEALTKARSELANVARINSLGVLTASIAHEVNQPLSGIITNASTCLRMLDGNPPNIDGARETARRTIRDGNRASDVITRLRALFSRKEVNIESVDLNEATREVIALSLSELQNNQVILQYEFAEDMPPVKGDRIQLQQVILNLLRNAFDAMSIVNNRPRQLIITTTLDFEHVYLAVKDTGVGFNPEVADRLFESLYTTKQDGMGIGLTISRSIIEAHGGRLWATSNKEPGSTFAFSIPRNSSTSHL